MSEPALADEASANCESPKSVSWTRKLSSISMFACKVLVDNMITRYHHSTHTAKITVDHCLRMEVAKPHGYFEHLIINVSYEVKNKLVGSKVRLTHLAKGTTPPVESRWYIQSFMLPFCIQSETIQ